MSSTGQVAHGDSALHRVQDLLDLVSTAGQAPP
jgi:hypothetical protein